MATYADEWNQRQEILGTLPRSNPVRLTISKGNYVLDPNSGKFHYQERWEEQDLMDFESLHEQRIIEKQTIRLTSGQTLWVLDTNTLLSAPSLDLLKALFSLLLSLQPSPISLVIPYTVITELDSQKASPRTGFLAREANRWILAAIQAQKKSLPERQWAMHVQSSSHHDRTKTNDEKIIDFCKMLNQQQGNVLFCSNDASARLRAETEGIMTLELAEVVRNLKSEDVRRDMQCMAKIVLEQWVYQAGDGQVVEPIPEMDVEIEEEQWTTPSAWTAALGTPAPPTDPASWTAPLTAPVYMAAPPSTPAHMALPSSRPSASPPGRSISDSIHARRARPASYQLETAPVHQQAAAAEETNPYIEWTGPTHRW